MDRGSTRFVNHHSTLNFLPIHRDTGPRTPTLTRLTPLPPFRSSGPPVSLSIYLPRWLERSRAEDRPRLMFPTKLQPFLRSSLLLRSLIGLTSLSLSSLSSSLPLSAWMHRAHSKQLHTDRSTPLLYHRLEGSSQQLTPEGEAEEAVKTLPLSLSLSLSFSLSLSLSVFPLR